MTSFGTPQGSSGSRPDRPDPRPGGMRVAGFQVRFTGGAFILAAFVILAASISLPEYAGGRTAAAYIAAGVAIAILMLASLALHELGHAIAARRRGVSIREIIIGFAGGTAHGDGDGELTGPKAQWRVAAAGPAVSLTLAAITGGAAAALAVTGVEELVMLILASVAVINAAVGVLGLLPGAGPDGSRIVRALAWARTGDPARAGVTASRAGQVTGVVLVGGGLTLIAIGFVAGLWVTLIGIMAYAHSRSELRQQRFSAVLAGLRVRDVMQPVEPGTEAQSWQTVAAFLDEHGLGAHAAAPGAARPAAARFGAPSTTATAFALREWDGEPGGLLTLSQLAAVPEDRREATRLREVATPMAHLVTAMPDEQLTDVLPRMSVLPRIPAAMHTAGHALVLSPDGSIVGLLTPADLSRAGQFGALRRNGDTAPSGMAGTRF